MPRKRSRTPKYRYHVSGQAAVRLDGKDYYLGKHDTDESYVRYHALLKVYNDNGCTMPDETITHQKDDVIVVRHVTAEHRILAKKKYAHCDDTRIQYGRICDVLETKFGDCPAADFGPRKLEEIRDAWVNTGTQSRGYINENVKKIVRIFRHAITREMVSENVLMRLSTLESLRKGQTTVPDRPVRQPVPIEVVRATAKHLSPVLKAMIAVQVQCGMRPGEVRTIRPCDIVRRPDKITGKIVWFYEPEKHKTANAGKRKVVPIIGAARRALAPFVKDKKPEEHCFSPAESAEWYREQANKARKTPPGQGNSRGRRRGGTKGVAGKRKPGKCFSKDSYRLAIQRAADKAKVERWVPYAIRHLTATEVTEALGLDVAQSLLGHSTRAQTLNYAKASEKRAIAAAEAAPTL